MPNPKFKPEGSSHFIPCPKQPLQSNGEDLANDWFFHEKNLRPLDHSLGLHSRPTQTSFESPSPLSKSKHFKLHWPLDFGLSVKGWEATLLDFLQFDWWKSTASRPLAIVWSAPYCACQVPIKVKLGRWKCINHFYRLRILCSKKFSPCSVLEV